MTEDISVVLNKNELLVELPTKIDKNNADDVYSKVITALSIEVTKLIFDAKELKYITPDGLDIFIEFKKKCADIDFKNTRMGICDIFESYGFTGFLNVEKEYQFLSVKGCEEIGHGGHGTMYKVGEDTIVKVYRDNSPIEIIENERRFARNAFINGIPTAIAYDVVKTEYGYGVIFEMLGGTTLGKYISANPDKLEEYSIKFAELLYQLNTTEADEDLFEDFQKVYLDRIENTKIYFKKDEVEQLKKVIKAIPKKNGMIHGDYHPNNVMVDANGELILIDMADISRGNGFFDIGGTYLILNYLCKKFYTRKKALNITSMNYKDCLKMWDIIVKTYYKTEDKNLLELYDKQCQAFSDMRMAASMGMNSSRSKFVTKMVVSYVKKKVIPKVDQYIELFSQLI